VQVVDRQPETSQLGQAHEEADHDLSDLLQELRILLQGVQVLTAFLIILPFSEGFGRVDQIEKWVYLVTFISSITGLVFISAPAAQHRLQRPLLNRVRFKRFATRMILIGTAAFSVALVLASQLVSNEVVGYGPSLFVASLVALLIGAVWWVIPIWSKRQGHHQSDE
jgi:amino acid transporter